MLLALLAVGLNGCATPGFARKPAQTAEDQYRRALTDLQDGLYPEALKGFATLKTKYPYTRFAALADLKTADTHYQRGQYPEAIDAYRNFLKYHPQHGQAAYAMLQIGQAYWEQIPSDWWFLPPAAEKDQANTRLAITAFRDAVARYPEHVVTDRARKRLDEARAKLAEHELYVADFYFKREKYEAAVARAEDLLASYGGLGMDRDALWIVARSHIRLGNHEAAQAALGRLSQEFPESSEGARATSMLRSMHGEANSHPAPKGGS